MSVLVGFGGDDAGGAGDSTGCTGYSCCYDVDSDVPVIVAADVIVVVSFAKRQNFLKAVPFCCFSVVIIVKLL